MGVGGMEEVPALPALTGPPSTVGALPVCGPPHCHELSHIAMVTSVESCLNKAMCALYCLLT